MIMWPDSWLYFRNVCVTFCVWFFVTPADPRWRVGGPSPSWETTELIVRSSSDESERDGNELTNQKRDNGHKQSIRAREIQTGTKVMSEKSWKGVAFLSALPPGNSLIARRTPSLFTRPLPRPGPGHPWSMEVNICGGRLFSANSSLACHK